MPNQDPMRTQRPGDFYPFVQTMGRENDAVKSVFRAPYGRYHRYSVRLTQSMGNLIKIPLNATYLRKEVQREQQDSHFCLTPFGPS